MPVNSVSSMHNVPPHVYHQSTSATEASPSSMSPLHLDVIVPVVCSERLIILKFSVVHSEMDILSIQIHSKEFVCGTFTFKPQRWPCCLISLSTVLVEETTRRYWM